LFFCFTKAKDSGLAGMNSQSFSCTVTSGDQPAPLTILQSDRQDG